MDEPVEERVPGPEPYERAASGADRATEQAWADLERRLSARLASMSTDDGGDHLVVLLPDDSSTGNRYVQFAAAGDPVRIRGEVVGNRYLEPAGRLDGATLQRLVDWGWTLSDDEHADDHLHGQHPSDHVRDEHGGTATGGGEPPQDVEGNHHCEVDRGDAAVLASRVVPVLRDIFQLPTPELLSVQAWGPTEHRVSELGITLVADVPVDVVDATEPDEPLEPVLAHFPGGVDELADMVSTVVEEFTGAPAVRDEDGDFVLERDGQVLWVRARADQPAVEVACAVLHGVRSRRQTAVELGLLNRDHTWTRWLLRGRSIWMTVVVPGAPFVPQHLSAMLAVAFDAVAENREDLALRTGGTPEPRG